MFKISWLVFAFVVGFAGRDRKIGYWGVFFISIFLSPIIALICALFSGRITERRELSVHSALEYANYIKSRKMTPTSFTILPKTEDERYIRLKASKIPNLEIGKPIVVTQYHNNQDKLLEQGDLIMSISIGMTLMDFYMDWDGKFCKIHEVGSFLLPNDPIYIISAEGMYSSDLV